MQKQQQQPRKEPEPIPVKIIQLVSPQGGPGLHGNSSISHRAKSKQSKHELDFRPWMRCFGVTFFPSDGEPQVFYIPEARVACWHPMD